MMHLIVDIRNMDFREAFSTEKDSKEIDDAFDSLFTNCELYKSVLIIKKLKSDGCCILACVIILRCLENLFKSTKIIQ